MNDFDEDPFLENYEDDGGGVSLDFLMNKKGIIGMILLGVAAVLGYFSFAKGTKKMAKKQIQNEKIYKKQNAEKVDQIKEIDRETKEIVKDLIELEEKSKTVEKEVPKIIDNVEKKIEDTKLPENEDKRTVKGSRDRLRDIANRRR